MPEASQRLQRATTVDVVAGAGGRAAAAPAEPVTGGRDLRPKAVSAAPADCCGARTLVAGKVWAVGCGARCVAAAADGNHSRGCGRGGRKGGGGTSGTGDWRPRPAFEGRFRDTGNLPAAGVVTAARWTTRQATRWSSCQRIQLVMSTAARGQASGGCTANLRSHLPLFDAFFQEVRLRVGRWSQTSAASSLLRTRRVVTPETPPT